jgi:AbrB family transcriptional regulator (stage V sporulation protein T)
MLCSYLSFKLILSRRGVSRPVFISICALSTAKGVKFVMKATGIVRKIDDLGRLVLPKELRKTLRIREGDSLEIFTNDHEQIILKKYSAILNLSSYAEIFTEMIHSSLLLNCLITDTANVLAASGETAKTFIGKKLHKDFTEFLYLQKNYCHTIGNNKLSVMQDFQNVYCAGLVPLASCGYLFGSILLVQPEKEISIHDSDFSTLISSSQILVKTLVKNKIIS